MSQSYFLFILLLWRFRISFDVKFIRCFQSCLYSLFLENILRRTGIFSSICSIWTNSVSFSGRLLLHITPLSSGHNIFLSFVRCFLPVFALMEFRNRNNLFWFFTYEGIILYLSFSLFFIAISNYDSGIIFFSNQLAFKSWHKIIPFVIAASFMIG